MMLEIIFKSAVEYCALSAEAKKVAEQYFEHGSTVLTLESDASEDFVQWLHSVGEMSRDSGLEDLLIECQSALDNFHDSEECIETQ